ncbi:MAG TPA: DUF3618 domain-containing protein [Chloroflexota bacterium]|nr:DUF3618 domain-containing protein [Chloroflexota bacterium]
MMLYDSSGGPGGASRSTDADTDDRDPEEIRLEIAQTRTEMSGTIDAIQQRLAPDVLSAQAKDIARDATDQAKTAAQEVLQDAVREVKDAAKEVTEHAVHEVKDAARDVTTGAKDAAWDATVGRAEEAVTTAGATAKGVSSIVIDTIKQNPIPAALAGLSLFWLYKNRAGGQASTTGSTAGTYRTPGSYQGATAPQAYPIRTGYASQEERDAMTSDSARVVAGSLPRPPLARESGETDDGMIGSAGQMASDAASTAGQIASDAASTAGHLASSASESAVDAGSSIVDLIQQNPVPAALVGIGLGWLYMNRSSGHPDYRAHSGTHSRYGSPAANQANRSGYQSTSGDGGMVSRATSQVGDLASSAQEHVGEMANSVQEHVGGMATSVQDHVGDMAGTVMDQTQRAPGQLQRLVQERPLTAAAVAASLGAAVGLWLPPTQLENQMMGAANAQVMGRAQEVASETMEKVQGVAQEVRTTVKEEAQAKGLTV